LHHEAERLPHTGRVDFYEEAFLNVERLTPIIESFK
jgi:hypothetical protein